MKKPKLIRVTTVPLSLDKLLEGQLKYMNQFYDVLVVSTSHDGYLQRVAEREGVRFHPINLTRAITPVQDFKSLIAMIRLFRLEKPDIVHSHTPKAGTVAMLAAKIAGVPVRMHTVAGLPLMESTGRKRELLDIVEKITYSAAHTVLPNSTGLRNIILSLGFTENKKLQVLGNGSTNGINTEYFSREHFSAEEIEQRRRDLGIGAEDLAFVFVGRLVGDKGINELVEAFNLLAELFDNVHLILVGPLEQELDPLLPETLEVMQSHPRIHSVGYQADVRPFLAASDALVFPSYREGFPNVVMQAGAMDLPAIVTDINGCNEIIETNENGVIIPPKSMMSLKKAMRLLVEQPELRKHLAQNARNMITERYSQQKVWEYIHQAYETALKSKAS
ncbi:MAG: glycosyltransferase family 4 protein [Weeksellaceae bacterium]|nr:glycosyltransferase family 4 protein [Weeksellaceae bacterium]